jgi:hypothetical protein
LASSKISALVKKIAYYVESGVPSETVDGKMLALLSIDICLT